jgi:DNA polymerase elongation subunit (family B)
MKTEICIFDIDYEEIDGTTSIVLYGRTPEGKRAVVVDPTYEPYFYVVPKRLDRAKRDVQNLLRQKNIAFHGIGETERILLGEKKKVLKIDCLRPQDTGKVRDIIKTLEEKRGGTGSVLDEYEYQMGFYRSYLADTGLSCLDWLVVEGSPFEWKIDADLVIKAKSLKKVDRGAELPLLPG